MNSTPDIVIIGSGIGGATLASGLADSGAKVLILERGQRLQRIPQARDPHAIFIDEYYRTTERWVDRTGREFRPSHYYCVGGNSKFYGTILMRYRREDFGELQHFEGVSPAWPFTYDEFEPWYCRAEQLYQVRGTLGQDPTEPYHSQDYSHGAVPDEPDMARFRERLAAVGMTPASLPLGIDIDAWLAEAPTPWDAFPDTTGAKMDAESCALSRALSDPNISLETGAYVERLETTADGKRIAGVQYTLDGETHIVRPKLVVLSAGAINSAILLLKSGNLANSSDMVGRNFMNHNGCVVLAIDPRRKNRAVYQKTIHCNDFYFGTEDDGRPLGNWQMIGKVSGAMLKSSASYVPTPFLEYVASHSVDCFVMSEDLPNPDSRVFLDGSKIQLHWQRSNTLALKKLISAVKQRLRAAGYPVALTQRYGEANPGHQCGTVRMGNDPSLAPLDPFCRSYDHDNLYVVDGSFLPCSAAVNPSLTIAAQALRVADHIRTTELA